MPGWIHVAAAVFSSSKAGGFFSFPRAVFSFPKAVVSFHQTRFSTYTYQSQDMYNISTVVPWQAVRKTPLKLTRKTTRQRLFNTPNSTHHHDNVPLLLQLSRQHYTSSSTRRCQIYCPDPFSKQVNQENLSTALEHTQPAKQQGHKTDEVTGRKW